MSSAEASLQRVRVSTAALLQGLEAERWTDPDVRVPSLLPGWTRAHVLTHIARNADGMSRALAGALRGEIVARYPHGQQGRNADIEAGATRGSVELVADVRESADRLDRIFTAVADVDGWQRLAGERSAEAHAVARWREVEVHRVDLGGAYAAADWPPEFVAYLLPELADGLGGRAGAGLRIEVTADGSITTDLPGRTWSVGTGDPVDVVGPDWALLAWLAGRPAAAHGVLSNAPDLAAWI